MNGLSPPRMVRPPETAARFRSDVAGKRDVRYLAGSFTYTEAVRDSNVLEPRAVTVIVVKPPALTGTVARYKPGRTSTSGSDVNDVARCSISAIRSRPDPGNASSPVTTARISIQCSFAVRSMSIPGFATGGIVHWMPCDNSFENAEASSHG
jgi:hypothetical protein